VAVAGTSGTGEEERARGAAVVAVVGEGEGEKIRRRTADSGGSLNAGARGEIRRPCPGFSFWLPRPKAVARYHFSATNRVPCAANAAAGLHGRRQRAIYASALSRTTQAEEQEEQTTSMVEQIELK